MTQHESSGEPGTFHVSPASKASPRQEGQHLDCEGMENLRAYLSLLEQGLKDLRSDDRSRRARRTIAAAFSDDVESGQR